MQKLQVKTMLTAFFDAKRYHSSQICARKQTINGKFYKEVIKRLIARVHCVRLEFQESGPQYLLHGIAPVYSLDIISKSVEKWGIPVLSCPPYSPDLALSAFFLLFPKLKIAMKGQDSRLFHCSNRLMRKIEGDTRRSIFSEI
jgi:hypothetical protein